jgi:type III secretory pathway component EscU
MDLDNIKKDWEQVGVSASINEEKIKMMLNNKGQGAYANLLKYEKFFLKTLLPCFVLGIIFYFISPYFSIAYSVLVIVSFFWQRYKIKYLEKTNFLEMDILEVSQRTNKYKSLLIKEILAGVILVFPLCGLYCYGAFYERSQQLFWISLSFMTIFVLAFCFIIYRVLYYRNIKYIEQSIKEVEEFEKDNI